MVNKLLINFTCLKNDSVFGFALETGASRAGNFCCPGRPQILSFFIDVTKVRIFHCGSRIHDVFFANK